MNNVDEVIQVISVGLVVAGFLLNTNRFLKGVELCKECLFLLKDRAGLKDEKLSKSFYKRINFTMWKACSIIRDNTSAIEYADQLLQIYRESGERLEEYKLSIDLVQMYRNQNNYAQAKLLSEKALRIIGEYDKAREHLEKSLVIKKKIGDRNGEACCHTNLGVVYASVGEYDKAKEHFEKSLVINKEIGDRNGVARCHTNLGNVYTSVGEYEEAREHLEKALLMHKEIRDKYGEARCNSNLGNVYKSVGDYEKASDYWDKSLTMGKEIGARCTVALSYLKLGDKFLRFGKYSKANECNQKALVIFREIGDRVGVAKFYFNQGAVLDSIGNLISAKEYFEKALAISKEIGSKLLEAWGCYILGRYFFRQAKYASAEDYVKKGLTLSEEMGDIKAQFQSLTMMAKIRMNEGKTQEAISYFRSGIEICETMHDSLRDNDQFKISFLDDNILSYRQLSCLLCANGRPGEGLYISELSKARALADLMLARYFAQNKISANPRTWVGLEGIVAKECNRTCLFVSYHCRSIHLWTLKATGVTHFQMIKGSDLIAQEGLGEHLETFFDFRSFGVLPEELCEDQSLHSFQIESQSCEEDSQAGWRIRDESKDNQGPKMNLPICY
ncbi:tetratricopeptide repeat protein 28-like [Orbicella faveolata]|uniref:tetratricopeptide repeat protein 28-like n=1 Tax=Orbicella faveolata TaxID=48498 RepID=UPI0009E53B10|nr:tetratricopeptide repeat protein 28-like [Orbicella faveolata]